VSPLTHFLGSWLVAAATTDNSRDRKLVTLAGVLPDADGLGLVVDVVKAVAGGGEPAFAYYHRYHHVLLHGWPAALVVSALLAGLAHRRARVALMSLVVFHLHLLGDLLGSRGPSPADLWPICYGEPLFRHPIWLWKGQWRLDGWQNVSVSVAVFLLTLWVAVKRGFSPAEFFGARAEAGVAGVLRKWREKLDRDGARRRGRPGRASIPAALPPGTAQRDVIGQSGFGFGKKPQPPATTHGA
jgi:inner membrane protein